jgi:hypothetical protein
MFKARNSVSARFESGRCLHRGDRFRLGSKQGRGIKGEDICKKKKINKDYYIISNKTTLLLQKRTTAQVLKKAI